MEFIALVSFMLFRSCKTGEVKKTKINSNTTADPTFAAINYFKSSNRRYVGIEGRKGKFIWNSYIVTLFCSRRNEISASLPLHLKSSESEAPCLNRKMIKKENGRKFLRIFSGAKERAAVVVFIVLPGIVFCCYQFYYSCAHKWLRSIDK